MLTNAADGCIGIYDSGVGGLSVLPAIRALLPHEDLVYIADAAHLPYGEKSESYLIDRALRIASFFEAAGGKAIAIPCNTATAAAAGFLRGRYPDAPVVGIEPAVKPAAALTRSGAIGVLATTGTLSSDRFLQLVQREAPGVRVLHKPCPGWVDLVEHGAPEADVQRLVAAPVQELLAEGADVLVLGCTHFPFLLPWVRKIVGAEFPVLETAAPFARQLHKRLAEKSLLRTQGSGSLRILTSANPEAIKARVARLMPGAGKVLALPQRYC